MQKIAGNETKKWLLNDLIQKLDKASSTDRTSDSDRSGRSCSSRTHENAETGFRLTRRSTSGRNNFAGHSAFRRTR